jgi:sugar/nucleoside kinase (ribokinase family)
MIPPQDRPYDVYGVGNALVDILAQVDDDFVASFELPKGAMTLMDSVQQASVLQQLETQSLHLASGGSAANTMIALAQSGGSGFYAGKVAHDPHGEFYRRDMNDAGVEFEVEPAPEAGDPTGSCVVLTTPDAERTMCTHLGVSTTLHAEDIDANHLAQCKYSYIEGYLWDADEPRSACVRAMELSKEKQTLVAFTVSDAFLIDRYAREFYEMIPKYCDVLFCNSYEARQLCETDSLAVCVQKLGQLAPLVFMTESEKGCRVIRRDDVQHVEGFPVKAIDTVGAGDAFAGGTLYGLCNSMDPLTAARWGNFLASKVVSIIGPRLHRSMKPEMASIVSV